MSKSEPPYDVGYGKPPKVGQFSKGQSGNPKGRPKGSKNLATVVLRESRQPVIVNGPKGKRRTTKLEAAVMQLGNKAAQGDLPSQRELFALVQRSEEAVTSQSAPQSIHELDKPVIQSILRRMASVDTGTLPNLQPNGGEETK